ncbi:MULTISPECIES: cobalt ECF transporter T component CbiQ [unclassified Fusibacter]|uniref:cobalt ECF transporter T component CbiQ n=1 Tax=unclassified Fusibacter TaxID=2624464 RepID=UPI001012364A|nr:cobalt ECF transporter T component CbiQ [Fusibacter sp. A1]MCK8060516.1 cobalt ECF transporter T component CbiQ [Fusibacter sp. A2]NPE20195.1 cobalt ECF transporter T component CbiQ [Fusibacter sp. A1]RXV63405.1 cobalt ECF transporter T component CbiQ [Fusibacter sp. A1]
MLSTDFYANNHPWRDVNTGAKAFYCFLCFTLSFIWPGLPVLGALILLSLGILSRSRHFKLKRVLKSWSGVLAFLSVGSLGVAVGYGLSEEAMLLSAAFGKGYIGIYSSGLSLGLKLVFRSMACFTALYTYINITPMKHTMDLFKKLKVPGVFLEILEISYRFIFIFIAEAGVIYQSQKMRLGYCSKRTSIRSLGIMVGALFVRVFDKTDKMHTSIVLRLGEDH